MATDREIDAAIDNGGLSGRSLCVHASLRSLGPAAGGPETLLNRFLSRGCTVMVPTFSFKYLVMPPAHLQWSCNGVDYDNLHWIDRHNELVYRTESNLLDLAEMGKFPEAVLNWPGRSRGNHPLCSFAAAGSLARELIEVQQPMDVYAPLRELAARGGAMVLIGVGLQRLTALHLAEQMAGRRMFVRWARGRDGRETMAECGGDSEGFDRLSQAVAPSEVSLDCGGSHWRVFDAARLLALASGAIRKDPSITHCGKQDCLRCRDAVAGGPLTNLARG